MIKYSEAKMKEITHKDYLKFLKQNKDTIAELKLGEHKPKQLEPMGFKLEASTIWPIGKEEWATHALNKEFRVNWDPEIARNVILRYSEVGNTVLDPFVGTGTTLIECKLLKRDGVGVDISKEPIMLSRDRLNFDFDSLVQKTFVGDARKLDRIDDETIDLIATHPPFFKFMFSEEKTKDLADIKTIKEFIAEMKNVAKELFRVLKPGKHCAVLMGDAKHNNKHYPVAYNVMQMFLDSGFELAEDVIKIQKGSDITKEMQEMSEKRNSLFLIHEHLFIFKKP